MSHNWYACDGFYLTKPFETEIMNKKSIHRHFRTPAGNGNYFKFTYDHNFWIMWCKSCCPQRFLSFKTF